MIYKSFLGFLVTSFTLLTSLSSQAETEFLIGKRQLIPNDQVDEIEPNYLWMYIFSRVMIGFDSKFERYQLIVEQEFDALSDGSGQSEAWLRIARVKNICFACRDRMSGQAWRFRRSNIESAFDLKAVKALSQERSWNRKQRLEVSTYFTDQEHDFVVFFNCEGVVDCVRGNLFITILGIYSSAYTQG